MVQTTAINTTQAPKLVQETGEQRKVLPFRGKDTVGKAAPGEKKGGSFERVALPKGKPSSPDYLNGLAQAFGKIYSQMAASTIEQTQDMTKTQQLDETMMKISLISSDRQMKSEKNGFEEKQQILDKQEKDEDVSDFMFWFGIGVTALLILVTVASAAVDFGASLALVPEEAAMMGEEVGEEGIEMTTMDTTETVTENGTETSTTDSTELTNVNEGSMNMDESEPMENLETNESNEAMENDQSSSETQNNDSKENLKKSTNKWRVRVRDASQKVKDFGSKIDKYGGKRAFNIVGSLGFALPEAYSAAMKIEGSTYKDQLSKVQKTVGKETAALRKDSGYLRYFQQLVQRASNIGDTLASQLGEVVTTAGSTFKAYRQISYGLAQTA